MWRVCWGSTWAITWCVILVACENVDGVQGVFNRCGECAIPLFELFGGG